MALGLIHDLAEVQTIYYDPALDPWRTHVLPKLRRHHLKTLAKVAQISQRQMRARKNGHSVPRERARKRLLSFLIRAERRRRNRQVLAIWAKLY
jgi:hypothetical protein